MPPQPTQFTKLFYKHCDLYFDFDAEHKLKAHPFAFIESYISPTNPEKFRFDSFEPGFDIFQLINKQLEQQYQVFHFELSLLIQGRIEYLNEQVDIIYGLYHKISGIKSSSLDYRLNQQKIHLLVRNILKELLSKIFVNYHQELNNKHRLNLSKWYYLKPTITSFKLLKSPENRNFEIIYKRYLEGSFVDPRTKFSTFRALFEGKNLRAKINWIDNKSSLYYFVRELTKSKAIKSTRNKHWQITAEFFLLNGEELLPSDFPNQQETQDENKRELIDGFIQILNRRFY